jgi:hypothetical protein
MTLRTSAAGPALVLLLAPWLGGTPPCQKDVHLIFQAEPVGSTGDLFFGAASGVVIGVPPALPVARHTAAAAIVSDLGAASGGGGGLCRGSGCSGVQGWSVSIALEGDLDIVGATVREANPQIVCGGAFIVTHLVDPERPGPGGEPQGKGVTSAVVFLCGDVFTLQTHATDTVLGITLESPRPATGQSVSGKLVCRDGLVGQGAPVPNIATIGGNSLPFCTCSDLTVRFDGIPSFPFRRCDTDGSGRLEVSDAISFLSWLFLRGEAPACAPAADCDGDRRHTVTDAVHALLFLFGGGAPPPLPFPDCGFAAEPAEACTTQTDGCPA